MIVLLLLMFFATYGFADFDNSEGQLKRLQNIQHAENLLVIGDNQYIMPIDFKVFRYKNGDTERTNRYALKEGQSVYINTEVHAKKDYVTELLIMSD